MHWSVRQDRAQPAGTAVGASSPSAIAMPPTPTRAAWDDDHDTAHTPPQQQQSRGPRGELLHTPPVLLPSLSLNSTARTAPSSVTTATGSSARYSWQDGGRGGRGGRAQSPSTPTQQQQQHHRQRAARDSESSAADDDGSAIGPSVRDPDRDRNRERERTATPSSHPLVSTNSTDSTFSSSASSSSASASASSDNDWARSWIDADHDHDLDLDRAYEQQQQQHQRGFDSNSGLAAAAPSFDPLLLSGARADTTTVTTSALPHRSSRLSGGGGDRAQEEEEEEEAGEEGERRRRKRVEGGEVREEDAGARKQQAPTADTGMRSGTGQQQQEQQEEQEQQLQGLLRQEDELEEEDLADLTPMVGSSGFGSPPSSPSAMRSNDDVNSDVLPTGATAASPSSRPVTTTTTVILPTIEPLFSNRTRSDPAAAAARGLEGAVQSRSGGATTAVAGAATPSSSRPLSEFDWAAAYADGGGGAASSSTLPAVAVEAKSSADAAPERIKATEMSSNLATPTTPAVSSISHLEPTPPRSHGMTAIRDATAPLDPLPPQEREEEQEQEQDPMAMLDSLIYQPSLASESEPLESTTAPAAHSMGQSRDESTSLPSPSSAAFPKPVLPPGSTALPSVQSPTSPTANANVSTSGNGNGNGNGNGRKERGPAPVIPVKSSRRASLLGRGRRQSADSQTLLQRATSMVATSSSSPRSAVGGTAMPSDPSSSSFEDEEGPRARTVSPPSHARSGSVPLSASATSPGPASGLSSPSAGGGAANSPALSR